MENLGGFLLKYNVRVAGMENSFGHGVNRLAGKRLLLSRKGVLGSRHGNKQFIGEKVRQRGKEIALC